MFKIHITTILFLNIDKKALKGISYLNAADIGPSFCCSVKGIAACSPPSL